MAKFHPLTVKDIRRETVDCVSIAFEVPTAFQSDYQYIQGQYVTLKFIVDGEEIRRSYSICSSPVADNELRIAAKKVTQGKGSGYLNDTLKVGDIMEVMTPMGNFHSPLDANKSRNFVLFAGGSGITPMLSILKTVLKVETKSSIILFYANLNEESTIFKDEIQSLENANPNFKVITILDQPATEVPQLHKGIMTKKKVFSLIENYVGLNLDNQFFICGPTPMMKNVEESLIDLKIEKERIHLEYFTATLEAAKTEVKASGNVITSQVTIILDGDETTIELKSDGLCILDAAIENDLDVPFACKGAVCCTCRAKVIEGEVEMRANFALTEDEVAEGFILTCQSHPKSATVIVDYDV